ncbi:AlbA family DNA-binding domain-containing protein [Glutamicibacter arilaitensis]|uniref:AlbA family DNA-binding domain-containing protein n=1 Tax=Glutamicibacter arilaitensis TaxID=256701 RepID=UPI003FD55372
MELEATEHIDVSEERLKFLLQLGTETAFHDYKSSIDLRSKPAQIEFVKDVAAFSDQGGWIVVGADSAGVPVPWQCNDDDWDGSRISGKLSTYLSPGYRIFAAVHQLGQWKHVLIQVLPHPEGACVFLVDGNVPDQKGKAQSPVFRKGDIYTRIGHDSKKADQQSLNRILDKRAHNKATREAAAALARQRAMRASLVGEPSSSTRGKLRGQIGWATTSKPNNLTERIFFSKERFGAFEDFLFGLLESKHLRRDGHVYSSEMKRMPDHIRSSGVISFSGEKDASCDVRVYTDGSISIYFEEEIEDWDYQELLGWWAYGATVIAYKIMSALDLHGTLFASYYLPIEEYGMRTMMRDISFSRPTDEDEEHLRKFVFEDIEQVASKIRDYQSSHDQLELANWRALHSKMLSQRSSWGPESGDLPVKGRGPRVKLFGLKLR